MMCLYNRYAWRSAPVMWHLGFKYKDKRWIVDMYNKDGIRLWSWCKCDTTGDATPTFDEKSIRGIGRMLTHVTGHGYLTSDMHGMDHQSKGDIPYKTKAEIIDVIQRKSWMVVSPIQVVIPWDD